MKALTAKDAKYGFGWLIDLDRAELMAVVNHGRPVIVVMAVVNHGRPVIVVMAVEEFEA